MKCHNTLCQSYQTLFLQVGKKGTFNLISAVTIGPAGEIVISDSRIQVFSAKGDFREVLYDDVKGEKQFCSYLCKL